MRPIIVVVIVIIIGSIWYLQPFRPRTIDTDQHPASPLPTPSPAKSAPEPYPVNPTPPPPEATIDKKTP